MKNVKTAHWVIIAMVLSASLSACSGPPQPSLASASASASEPAATDIPILALPTPTHAPAATATAMPTPVPLIPLSIEAIRKQDYPGSDIVIEQWMC